MISYLKNLKSQINFIVKESHWSLHLLVVLFFIRFLVAFRWNLNRKPSGLKPPCNQNNSNLIHLKSEVEKNVFSGVLETLSAKTLSSADKLKITLFHLLFHCCFVFPAVLRKSKMFIETAIITLIIFALFSNQFVKTERSKFKDCRVFLFI